MITGENAFPPSSLLPPCLQYVVSSWFVLSKHGPDEGIGAQLIKEKIDNKCMKNPRAY